MDRYLQLKRVQCDDFDPEHSIFTRRKTTKELHQTQVDGQNS